MRISGDDREWQTCPIFNEVWDIDSQCWLRMLISEDGEFHLQKAKLLPRVSNENVGIWRDERMPQITNWTVWSPTNNKAYQFILDARYSAADNSTTHTLYGRHIIKRAGVESEEYLRLDPQSNSFGRMNREQINKEGFKDKFERIIPTVEIMRTTRGPSQVIIRAIPELPSEPPRRGYHANPQFERTSAVINEALISLRDNIEFFTAPAIEAEQFNVWARAHQAEMRVVSEAIEGALGKDVDDYLEALRGPLLDEHLSGLAGNNPRPMIALLEDKPQLAAVLTTAAQNPIVQQWYTDILTDKLKSAIDMMIAKDNPQTIARNFRQILAPSERRNLNLNDIKINGGNALHYLALKIEPQDEANTRSIIALMQVMIDHEASLTTPSDDGTTALDVLRQKAVAQANLIESITQLADHERTAFSRPIMQSLNISASKKQSLSFHRSGNLAVFEQGFNEVDQIVRGVIPNSNDTWLVIDTDSPNGLAYQLSWDWGTKALYRRFYDDEQAEVFQKITANDNGKWQPMTTADPEFIPMREKFKTDTAEYPDLLAAYPQQEIINALAKALDPDQAKRLTESELKVLERYVFLLNQTRANPSAATQAITSNIPNYQWQQPADIDKLREVIGNRRRTFIAIINTLNLNRSDYTQINRFFPSRVPGQGLAEKVKQSGIAHPRELRELLSDNGELIQIVNTLLLSDGDLEKMLVNLTAVMADEGYTDYRTLQYHPDPAQNRAIIENMDMLRHVSRIGYTKGIVQPFLSQYIRYLRTLNEIASVLGERGDYAVNDRLGENELRRISHNKTTVDKIGPADFEIFNAMLPTDSPMRRQETESEAGYKARITASYKEKADLAQVKVSTQSDSYYNLIDAVEAACFELPRYSEAKGSNYQKVLTAARILEAEATYLQSLIKQRLRDLQALENFTQQVQKARRVEQIISLTQTDAIQIDSVEDYRQLQQLLITARQSADIKYELGRQWGHENVSDTLQQIQAKLYVKLLDYARQQPDNVRELKTDLEHALRLLNQHNELAGTLLKNLREKWGDEFDDRRNIITAALNTNLVDPVWDPQNKRWLQVTDDLRIQTAEPTQPYERRTTTVDGVRHSAYHAVGDPNTAEASTWRTAESQDLDQIVIEHGNTIHYKVKAGKLYRRSGGADADIHVWNAENQTWQASTLAEFNTGSDNDTVALGGEPKQVAPEAPTFWSSVKTEPVVTLEGIENPNEQAALRKFYDALAVLKANTKNKYDYTLALEALILDKGLLSPADIEQRSIHSPETVRTVSNIKRQLSASAISDSQLIDLEEAAIPTVGRLEDLFKTAMAAEIQRYQPHKAVAHKAKEDEQWQAKVGQSILHTARLIDAAKTDTAEATLRAATTHQIQNLEQGVALLQKPFSEVAEDPTVKQLFDRLRPGVAYNEHEYRDLQTNLDTDAIEGTIAVRKRQWDFVKTNDIPHESPIYESAKIFPAYLDADSAIKYIRYQLLAEALTTLKENCTSQDEYLGLLATMMRGQDAPAVRDEIKANYQQVANLVDLKDVEEGDRTDDAVIYPAFKSSFIEFHRAVLNAEMKAVTEAMHLAAPAEIPNERPITYDTLQPRRHAMTNTLTAVVNGGDLSAAEIGKLDFLISSLSERENWQTATANFIRHMATREFDPVNYTRDQIDTKAKVAYRSQRLLKAFGSLENRFFIEHVDAHEVTNLEDLMAEFLSPSADPEIQNGIRSALQAKWGDPYITNLSQLAKFIISKKPRAEHLRALIAEEVVRLAEPEAADRSAEAEAARLRAMIDATEQPNPRQCLILTVNRTNPRGRISREEVQQFQRHDANRVFVFPDNYPDSHVVHDRQHLLQRRGGLAGAMRPISVGTRDGHQVHDIAAIGVATLFFQDPEDNTDDGKKALIREDVAKIFDALGQGRVIVLPYVARPDNRLAPAFGGGVAAHDQFTRYAQAQIEKARRFVAGELSLAELDPAYQAAWHRGRTRPRNDLVPPAAMPPQVQLPQSIPARAQPRPSSAFDRDEHGRLVEPVNQARLGLRPRRPGGARGFQASPPRAIHVSELVSPGGILERDNYEIEPPINQNYNVSKRLASGDVVNYTVDCKNNLLTTNQKDEATFREMLTKQRQLLREKGIGDNIKYTMYIDTKADNPDDPASVQEAKQRQHLIARLCQEYNFEPLTLEGEALIRREQPPTERARANQAPVGQAARHPARQQANETNPAPEQHDEDQVRVHDEERPAREQREEFVHDRILREAQQALNEGRPITNPEQVRAACDYFDRPDMYQQRRNFVELTSRLHQINIDMNGISAYLDAQAIQQIFTALNGDGNENPLQAMNSGQLHELRDNLTNESVRDLLRASWADNFATNLASVDRAIEVCLEAIRRNGYGHGM